jgi:hypothetical protein
MMREIAGERDNLCDVGGQGWGNGGAGVVWRKKNDHHTPTVIIIDYFNPFLQPWIKFMKA